MTQVFVDMDGVLADFDTGHEKVFGYRSDKLLDNVDWRAVRAAKDFYLNLPPMPDLDHLWRYLEPYRPIVLTGVPYSVQEAPENKRAWISKHLGDHVEVRCCPSKNKCLHAQVGDILIDDWEKYKSLWIGKGGVWVTHLNAETTIAELEKMKLDPISLSETRSQISDKHPRRRFF